MTVATFGPVLSTVNNTVEAATLTDGRIIVGIQSNAVNVYSPTGALLGSVDPYQNGAGLAIISAGGHVAALADGGFVVTGARGSEIAFRIYNADLTERTSGAVTIATPGFFNGGTNYGHGIKVLSNGSFVVEWNSNQNPLPGSSPIGSIGGNSIFEAGSGPRGTAVDIRASIYNASGTLTSAPGFIVTQGDVQFPSYTIFSRFGDQYLNDIDALPDEPGQPTGRFVTTYIGDRWGMPSGNPALVSPVRYDLIRVNDGTTGGAIVGETPANATTPIGQEPTNTAGMGPHQSVVLSSGLIASIYTIDTGLISDSRYVSKLQLFNTNGVPNGVEIDLALAFSHNTSSSGLSQVNAIATPSGGFLLAYLAPPTLATVTNGATYEVFVREYASNGTVINTQQVTTASGPESILNLTAGPDGTFLLTSRINFSGNASTQLLTVTGAGDFAANGLSTAETLNATGTNRNWIWSGGGNDTINGGTGTNYLYGDTGNSTFNGGSGVNVMRGGTGNEIMRGGAQNDTLDGGGGDDNLQGGAGADSLVGGTGFDIARYDDAWGVQVDILYSNAFGSFAAGDRFSGIEGVSGSNNDDGVWGTDGNNTIFTWLGNDYIDGRGGVDVLLGGANNDTLVGGAGGDYLAGEAGADVFRYIALTDSGPSAQDYLPDFSSAQGDKIDVSAFAGTATFNSGFGTGTSVYAFSQGGGAWTLVQFYQGSTLHLQIVVNAPSLSAGDFIL